VLYSLADARIDRLRLYRLTTKIQGRLLVFVCTTTPTSAPSSLEPGFASVDVV
jgi:hypothetical protein